VGKIAKIYSVKIIYKSKMTK